MKQTFTCATRLLESCQQEEPRVVSSTIFTPQVLKGIGGSLPLIYDERPPHPHGGKMTFKIGSRTPAIGSYGIRGRILLKQNSDPETTEESQRTSIFLDRRSARCKNTLLHPACIAQSPVPDPPVWVSVHRVVLACSPDQSRHDACEFGFYCNFSS